MRWVAQAGAPSDRNAKAKGSFVGFPLSIIGACQVRTDGAAEGQDPPMEQD